jgi:hypothetical protein
MPVRTRMQAIQAFDKATMDMLESGQVERAILVAEMLEAEAETPLIQMNRWSLKKYMTGLGLGDNDTLTLFLALQKLQKNEMYKMADKLFGISRPQIQGDTLAAIFRNILYALAEKRDP